MNYLVLLYGDEAAATEPGTPEFDAEMAAYGAFDERAGDTVRGGAALHLAERARTIRHDGAGVTVTDGPFAETTEVLGGYYLFEVDDLDAVIELARHIPATAHGAAEIRPMVVNEALRPEGEMLPGLWLATLHRADDADAAEDADDAATQPGSPAWEQGAAAHAEFVEANRERLVRLVALHPTTSATTVRLRGDEVVVADGPVDPAVAVVGGFYVIQGDAAEALAVARQIPVDGGAVELRPLMDLGGT